MAAGELTRLQADHLDRTEPDAGGPVIRRPADLVELAELTYRGIFTAGLVVACIATVYAAGLTLLQPGPRTVGVAVCLLLALAAVAASWRRVRLYSLLRRRPGLLFVPAVAIGAGSWAVGSHNQQMFYVLTIVISSLGVAVSLPTVTVAALLTAAGIAAPHVVDGNWTIGNALAAAVVPPLSWLIVEQLARFMLRLTRALDVESDRPPIRVRVRNWAYRPPRPQAASNEQQCAGVGTDVAAPDAAQLARNTLTSRQRQVLLLVAEGLQNVEIAKCLGIGAAQVGRHLANACERAGVATNGELMAWAKRHGLIPHADDGNA